MKCLSPLRRFLLPALLLLGLPAGALAKDAPDLGAALPVDPALEKVGQLDNGMQYWIRPHSMPKGKVSLFLHIGSGSLQEQEDQRGLAHFLEHMAFNGSKHFPPGEMVSYFESMGMRFGQHQNAFTSFDQTTYIMSLPDTKSETLSKALLFFSDVAHELLIAPAEVEKERGVILEEARARSGVGMRMMEKLLPLMLPGTRLSRRIPIGDLDVVRSAPVERLRNYYETWYRPDRTTLLVVGDIEPAAVEPLLRKAFAGWKKPAAAAPAIDTGVKPFDSLRAGVVVDPEQSEADLTVNMVRSAPALKTVGDLRGRLLERLGVSMVNRRLNTLIQEDKVAFTEAGVQRGTTLAGMELLGFGASSELGRWQESLQQLVGEVRRVRTHGFGDKELARAKQAMLAQAEQAVQRAPSVPAMALGQQLNGAITEGRKPMSAAQRQALMQALLPGVTGAEVRAAFAALLTVEKAFVIGAFPKKEGVATPGKAEVLAAYREALRAEVGKRAERADVGALMEKDPEPGTVVKREVDADLGVTSLTLSNGAHVHIKVMPSVKTVRVRVLLFGGLPEEQAAQRGFTEAAGIALEPGRAATAHLKPAELTQVLSGLDVQVSGGPGEVSMELNVAGAAASLEKGLRLAWLLLTEPRVDEASLASWKRGIKTQLDQEKVSPPAQAMRGLQRVASGGDVRFRRPSLEQYEAITRDQAQGWLDRLVKQAPIEVVIAGGIDPQEAERLACQWFGSLPARPDRSVALRALRTVKGPTGPVLENVKVDTVTPMAFVLLAWRGVGRDEVDAQVALIQATTMLSSRLIQSVREERGLTYSIGAGYQFTNYEGMDGMAVQFTADPAKAKEAASVAKQTVLDFLKEGPTEAEIEATERQFENVLGAQMQVPQFWTGILAKLHANGRSLAGVKARLKALRTVDKQALMAALKRVVKDTGFVRVIAAP